MPNRWFLCGFAVIFTAHAAYWASAAQQPASMTADREGAVDEAISFFLLESLRACAVLRDQGQGRRANGLWESATRFVSAVRDADRDDQPLFLPIISGFRTAIAERVLRSDTASAETVDAIKTSLDDQIRIHTAPGAYVASRNGVHVSVRTAFGNRPVTGLYVWFDLTCCIPRHGTAYSVPGVTPTEAFVGPGDYLVRAVRGDQALGSRTATIGRAGDRETVTIQLDSP